MKKSFCLSHVHLVQTAYRTVYARMKEIIFFQPTSLPADLVSSIYYTHSQLHRAAGLQVYTWNCALQSSSNYLHRSHCNRRMLSRLANNSMRAACRSRQMSTSAPAPPSTTSLSTPTPTAVAAPVAKQVVASSSEPARKAAGGSTITQRVSSFLMGAGLGFGVGFYYIFQEIEQSNNVFQKYLHRIEERVRYLEGKK